MQAHLEQFRVTSMCRGLGVERCGFYAWQRQPHSTRYRKDQRLVGMIKFAWLESGRCTTTARSPMTCATWANAAASIAWLDLCRTKVYRRK